MKNKNLFVLIGFGITLFLVGFYWFQIRPAYLKGFCDKKIRSESGGKIVPGYQTKYNACLYEKGIK